MDIATTVIGEYTVHAVEDGFFVRTPTDVFPASDPAAWTSDVPGVRDDGLLRVTLGCFVVRGPEGVTLIDTGGGDMTPPGEGEAGRLPEALALLEIDPTDIAAVVHTHLHPDHTGGDVVDGVPFFPNATFFLHERELAFWFDEAHEERERGRAPFRAIVERDLHQTVTGDEAIGSHLRVIETFGHTAGHLSVMLESGNERLLVGGDVTHSPLQAVHPEWNVGFDADQDAAATTRRRVFAMLADTEITLAAGHYPRPGLGRITSVGDGFRFDGV